MCPSPMPPEMTTTSYVSVMKTCSRISHTSVFPWLENTDGLIQSSSPSTSLDSTHPLLPIWLLTVGCERHVGENGGMGVSRGSTASKAQ